MNRIGKTVYIYMSLCMLLMSGCGYDIDSAIKTLNQDKNEAVRIELIRKISLEAKDGLLEKLLPFLSDREDMRASVDVLSGLFETGSVAIKKEAIITLGNLQDKRATKSLIEIAKNDSDELSVYAIEALGKIRDRDSVQFLLSLLDEREGDRNVIIWALGNIGDSRAVPVLSGLLGHNDKFVRFNTFNALKKIYNQAP